MVWWFAYSDPENLRWCSVRNCWKIIIFVVEQIGSGISLEVRCLDDEVILSDGYNLESMSQKNCCTFSFMYLCCGIIQIFEGAFMRRGDENVSFSIWSCDSMCVFKVSEMKLQREVKIIYFWELNSSCCSIVRFFQIIPKLLHAPQCLSNWMDIWQV